MQNGSSPCRNKLGNCGHTPKQDHSVFLANLTRWHRLLTLTQPSIWLS